VGVRHFKVHENYVWTLGHGQLAALLAVLRRENLEIADPLKAHLEHVEIVVVVFDVEHFSHVAVPVLLDGRSNYLVTRSPRRRGRAASVALRDRAALTVGR
jgi:hypothetical protein